MGALKSLAKQLGRDHDLAAAIWETGHYEARLLATLIDEPDLVTKRQMNAWVAEFDNWAICDTACFHLFDRTPHAWDMVYRWASARREFSRRTAFALIASLALHDRDADDGQFRAMLPLIEKGALDERNFVRKAVNWALRAVGERNPALNRAATDVAKRLAQSDDATPRWVGKDALRRLSSPAVRARLAARSGRTAARRRKR